MEHLLPADGWRSLDKILLEKKLGEARFRDLKDTISSALADVHAVPLPINEANNSSSSSGSSGSGSGSSSSAQDSSGIGSNMQLSAHGDLRPNNILAR